MTGQFQAHNISSMMFYVYMCHLQYVRNIKNENKSQNGLIQNTTSAIFQRTYHADQPQIILGIPCLKKSGNLPFLEGGPRLSMPTCQLRIRTSQVIFFDTACIDFQKTESSVVVGWLSQREYRKKQETPNSHKGCAVQQEKNPSRLKPPLSESFTLIAELGSHFSLISHGYLRVCEWRRMRSHLFHESFVRTLWKMHQTGQFDRRNTGI